MITRSPPRGGSGSANSMHTTAQRFHVPPGFSGHWCARCEKPVEGIPDEAGMPAKCPKCRHWTVYYIPAGLHDTPPEQPASKREQAGEQRKLSAGAEWQRKQPRPERARELFDHMRTVIEHPETNPDLSEIEKQEYER